MTNQKRSNEKKKIIGMITGSGPEAGIDLWMKILKANRDYLGEKFRGDEDAPHLIIHSIPELGKSMELHNNKELVWKNLKEAVIKISGDVDFFCIACNTLHYYSKNVKKLNPTAKFVSMVEAVKDYIKEKKIKKIALLGSYYGMKIKEWGIYSPLQKITEVEIPGNLEDVHQLVYDIKRWGSNDRKHKIKSRFKSIVEQFDTKNILLACTELPLVKLNMPDINFIDSTDLLAKELIKKIL